MDEAYYMLEELQAAGECVSLPLLNMIVRSCANAGDIDRAYATYEAFPKFKLQPNVETLEALLVVCDAYMCVWWMAVVVRNHIAVFTRTLAPRHTRVCVRVCVVVLLVS